MRQLKISKQITNRESQSLDKYLQEIGKVDLITSDVEVELAKRIREGDQIALEKLTKANLRFVVSVAKQYQNNGLTLGDLINEGNLGLIKAAKRFDETRGFKFISYAVWWIRQSIMQALAEQSRIVRLPLNRVGSLNKISKIRLMGDLVKLEHFRNLVSLSAAEAKIQEAEKNRLVRIASSLGIPGERLLVMLTHAHEYIYRRSCGYNENLRPPCFHGCAFRSGRRE